VCAREGKEKGGRWEEKVEGWQCTLKPSNRVSLPLEEDGPFSCVVNKWWLLCQVLEHHHPPNINLKISHTLNSLDDIIDSH